MKRFIAVFAAILVLVTGTAPLAAQSGVMTFVWFSEEAGELPEGIAADPQGNIYVGMAPTGEIRKVAPDGTVSTYAQLPLPPEAFLVGLAFDGFNNLYAAMVTFDPATHGIWRISPDGQAELWAPLDPTSFPNWLEFSGSNLLVSDTILGVIWLIDPDGNASIWVKSPLLLGDVDRSPLPFPIGANGMVIHDRYVYVANTGFGRIVRIPIGTGSRAGTPEVFVEDEELLYGADGLAFDDWGTLYVAVNWLDSIAAISPSGQITTLAQGGALQSPASVLAIGNVLYITNFAFAEPEGTRLPALHWMYIGPMGTGGGGGK
ncbi:MAG TPA: hypothetical protein VHL09_01020 [Dehalococcoidia bacterium]|nr:hypothetical protein [Dehalococcoidia bacterium]